MSQIVTFRITGHAAGTDAPSVEDALDQLRDYLDILRGVENAIAEDQTPAIVWRVVKASKQSPLTFQIEAFPKHYAINVDRRAGEVAAATARGLSLLQQTAERPDYFTDDVLQKAKRVFLRVTNGISVSEADFGDNLPKSTLTSSLGRSGSSNVSMVLQPIERPFQAIGSVEGYLQGAEHDGFGRDIAFLKERITGNLVKCLLAPKVREFFAERQISEIFSHRRALAFGRIHYKSKTKISHIETTNIRFLRSRADLPQIDDIIDRDFTGGLKTEDYLDLVRNVPQH